MSEPVQLTVTNTETNENNLIYDYKLFKLLRNEGLDTEPLDEYFDKINGSTKEQRIVALRKYEKWKAQQELKQEDNKLKEEIKNDN